MELVSVTPENIVASYQTPQFATGRMDQSEQLWKYPAVTDPRTHCPEECFLWKGNLSPFALVSVRSAETFLPTDEL